MRVLDRFEANPDGSGIRAILHAIETRLKQHVDKRAEATEARLKERADVRSESIETRLLRAFRPFAHPLEAVYAQAGWPCRSTTLNSKPSTSA